MDDTQTTADTHDGPGLFGDALPPPAPKPAGAAGAYRVLARKYRPAAFDDLIGQEPMVRTISNAFATGRIPQAWMLTGVRGVGKTTTARILARGLNYEPETGPAGGPTVTLPGFGKHCRAIIESRHVDVVEMDAASHNGVGDIREITEAARYKPAIARYKVYIMDEVHMLTTAAFNALLKTLEEPPEHVKFVFATTEIRKVPVTILSRCQRFDLRRVDAGVLVQHLARICAAEAVNAEPEALAAIARAAEGSVRDSLSLLDQAIAHAGGTVSAEGVRDMLGLADRARIVDLFEQVMQGDMAAALAELKALHDVGADAAVVVTDLAEFVHLVTRIKLVPAAADDPALSEVERKRGRAFAEKLSIRVLSRAWQIMLKGIAEVQGAARPLAAAEMLLVRVAFAADLPTPDDLIRKLAEAERAGAFAPAAPAPRGGGGGEMASAGGRPAATGHAAPAMLPAGVPQARTAGAPALAERSVQPPAGRSMQAPAGRPMQAPAGSPAGIPAPAAAGKPAPMLRTLEDVVALAREKRDIMLAKRIERDIRLVRLEEGVIEFALAAGGSPALPADLARKLSEWTGRRWVTALSTGEGAPTLAEIDEEKKRGVRANPLVQAVLARFPGAEIVDVKLADAARAALDDDAATAEDTAPPPFEDGDPGPFAGFDDDDTL